jgi:hypothetical protein
VTGYVVYVDDKNVYQTMGSVLDAWVILPPDTTHFVYVRAWDCQRLLSGQSYLSDQGDRAGSAESAGRRRQNHELMAPSWMQLLRGRLTTRAMWAGNATMEASERFSNSFDPNTRNAPDLEDFGQHWLVASECQYDDSLFYWKHAPSAFQESTNFLWDLWFYIPTTTAAATVQAIEFDLFSRRTVRRRRS